MPNHEGLGNFMVNDDEVSGTTLDLFSWPERENNILSGKEVEIRLFTVLERYVSCLYIIIR